MKKLLVLTTLMSSILMSSVAYAEWTVVEKDWKGSDGKTYSSYVDLDRIRESPDYIYYWFLISEKNGTESRLYLKEADCELFASRVMDTSHYKKPMAEGSGSVSITKSQIGNWYFATPNSSRELALNLICSGVLSRKDK